MNNRLKGLIAALRLLARQLQDGYPLTNAGRQIRDVIRREPNPLGALRDLDALVIKETASDPTRAEFWDTVRDIVKREREARGE